MIRLAPPITLALFLVPVIVGLIGTVLPAFGFLPAIGGVGPSLQPWRDLLAYPGLGDAVRLTVMSGFLATAVSFVIAIGTCAIAQGRPAFRRLQLAIAPVLAAPHSMFAIGFAFLVAPSGWLARIGSPWLTGWDQPPDIATVHDGLGLSLVAGLLLKEVPFLILMTFAALNQVPAHKSLEIAHTLGYARGVAWVKVVLPQIYPQLRLPIYAVLAFSLSVVDVALILGPGNPPPLAPLAVRWFFDPDVSQYFPAAAAACLQLAIVAAAIGSWRIAEILIGRIGRWWIERGGRGITGAPALGAAFRGTMILLALSALSFLCLALWSFTARWRYPDALPGSWTLTTWERHLDGLLWPGEVAIAVALASTIAALVLVMACLENEQRHGRRPGMRALSLLYVPLIVPQVGFLFGAQVVLLRVKLDGTWLALVWSHLLFVLPYVFLSLADPWRALDSRLVRTAACLGASPIRIFCRIKLPMLLRPILIASAVGFAVSVGQYLPTLFAGGGRFATLTTEAVTLAAGADRRVVGVYGFAQLLLPLGVYAAALGVPLLVFRNRKGLAVAR